jgi:hypothetical protein
LRHKFTLPRIAFNADRSKEHTRGADFAAQSF